MKKQLLTIAFAIAISTLTAQVTKWASQIGYGGGSGSASPSQKEIAVDGNGNVITTGRYSNHSDFDPGSGVFNLPTPSSFNDPYLLKLDSIGNFIWAKQLKFNPYATTVDNAGNIIIVGQMINTVNFDTGTGTYTLQVLPVSPANQPNAYIAKIDPSGNLIWAKNINTNEADVVKTDAAGNIYVVGSASRGNAVDYDPGAATYTVSSNTNINSYLLKLNAVGDFVWVKTFQKFSNNFLGTYLSEIKIDASNNIYLGGRCDGSGTDFDPGIAVYSIPTVTNTSYSNYVVKLTDLGDFVWAKVYGEQYTSLNAMDIDGLGNIYCAGNFSGIVDFDPSPSTTSTLNSVPGYTNSTTINDRDGYLLKLNNSGGFVSVKQYDGFYDIKAAGVTTDLANNVTFIGTLIGSLDADPNTGTYLISSPSSTLGGNFYSPENVFLSKLDNNGNFVWANNFKGADTQGKTTICSVTADNKGKMYVRGEFSNQIDFGLGGTAISFTPNIGSVNGYVCKLNLSAVSVGVNEFSKDLITLSVYPNPATSIINIELESDALEGKTTVSISNILGEEVLKTTENTCNFNLKTNHLKSGVYFVTLTNAGKTATKKIIIE